MTLGRYVPTVSIIILEYCEGIIYEFSTRVRYIPSFSIHEVINPSLRSVAIATTTLYKNNHSFYGVIKNFSFSPLGGVPDVNTAARSVLRDWNT